MNISQRSSALLVTLFVLNAAPAAGSDLCEKHENKLATAGLYAVCNEGKCTPILLKKDNYTELKRNKKYHLIYRTTASGIANSIIVVQFKYITGKTKIIQNNSHKTDIYLERQDIKFACIGKNKGVNNGKFPVEDIVEDKDLPSVAYGKFDRFHRGYNTTRDDEKMLMYNFHTWYLSGKDKNSCVASFWPGRREQFLFADRDKALGLFSSFIALWSANTTAIAGVEEVSRFDRLKVLISSYSKEPTKHGCISFPVDSSTESVEISLSDVELNLQSSNPRNRYMQTTWPINFTKK